MAETDISGGSEAGMSDRETQAQMVAVLVALLLLILALAISAAMVTDWRLQ